MEKKDFYKASRQKNMETHEKRDLKVNPGELLSLTSIMELET